MELDDELLDLDLSCSVALLQMGLFASATTAQLGTGLVSLSSTLLVTELVSVSTSLLLQSAGSVL